jgi:hypothetical protein
MNFLLVIQERWKGIYRFPVIYLTTWMGFSTKYLLLLSFFIFLFLTSVFVPQYFLIAHHLRTSHFIFKIQSCQVMKNFSYTREEIKFSKLWNDEIFYFQNSELSSLGTFGRLKNDEIVVTIEIKIVLYFQMQIYYFEIINIVVVLLFSKELLFFSTFY